jgi:hypothetical protein
VNGENQSKKVLSILFFLSNVLAAVFSIICGYLGDKYKIWKQLLIVNFFLILSLGLLIFYKDTPSLIQDLGFIGSNTLNIVVFLYVINIS